MDKFIQLIKRILLIGALCFVIWGMVSPAHLRANQQELEVALTRLEQLTGLNFKKDVQLERQSREEFQTFLRGEMKKTFPGDDLSHLGRIYNFVGFLPMSYRLEERLSDLYKDQVGAYYDPERGRIFQVAGDLSEASQFFLYLHEGVHALQDQHYDLGKKQSRLAHGTSLDQQLAFGFVVEGHANLVATAAQMNSTRLDADFFNSKRFEYVFELQSRLTNLSPGQFKAITKMFAGNNTPSARSLDKLSGVPLILVQQMADPYLVGQKLLFHRARKLGFDRSLDWLRSIPNSTQELLFEDTRGQYEAEVDSPSGVYETTMGSYLMMRWLNVFEQRPNWVAEVKFDRIALLGDPSDRAVAWRVDFVTAEAKSSFVDELDKFLTVNQEGNTPSSTFKRNDQTRHFWYKSSPTTLTLFFDDDDDIEPEISRHEYTIEQLSPGSPEFAGD